MPEPADLAVLATRVWTGEGDTDAIAVRGDRVVALGSDDVRPLIGAGTRVVEAPMVLPGFQDAHAHPPFAGRNLLQVWLNDLTDRPGYLAEIARYAQANPAEEWIVGGGWSMESFPGGVPNAADLDAIVPDRPVFLFNRDVHSAWLNTAALRAGGVTRDTPDPADGRIERDPLTGEPTGALHEGAAYTFRDRFLPAPSQADWEAGILAGQRHLHALGITSWQDAWVTPATLAAYRSLALDGRLTARVVGALWWERSRGLEQIADFVAQREAGAAPGFHPTTVKIMLDGVLETYTGALLEPYCDGCGGHTDNRGLAYLDPELMAAAVTELDRQGFQVHMHAIGDRAVRDCLDAVQAARTANGTADRRHHIAHIQVVQPVDVPRFAELGVVANMQAYWAQLEAQMVDLTLPFLGEERGRMQYPFADLLAAGAPLAMGSDWSVTTADPLQQIEVAVTRTNPDDRGAAAFLPDQCLPLEVALRAFTAGSAFVNHDPDGGVLRVGARADLAVLDIDLLAPGAPLPADATVQLTVASGAVVYEVNSGG